MEFSSIIIFGFFFSSLQYFSFFFGTLTYKKQMIKKINEANSTENAEQLSLTTSNLKYWFFVYFDLYLSSGNAKSPCKHQLIIYIYSR